MHIVDERKPHLQNQSRRRFLKAGGMVGTAVFLAPALGKIALAQQSSRDRLGSGIGFAVPKRVLRDPLYQIDRTMFEQTIGSPYGFWLDGKKLVDLTLIKVKDLTPVDVNGGVWGPKQCFQLVFEGPASMPLEQGTYELFGGGFPVFRLFIGAAAESKDGLAYEAIINRLNP